MPEPPPWLCAQPPAVHAVHPRLRSTTCREVCGRRHQWPDFKRQWEFVSGGSQQSCRVVHREHGTCCLLSTKPTRWLLILRKRRQRHTPPVTSVSISGAEVEQMNTFKFLGIDIRENLSWTSHMSRLYFSGNLWRKNSWYNDFHCLAVHNEYSM